VLEQLDWNRIVTAAEAYSHPDRAVSGAGKQFMVHQVSLRRNSGQRKISFTHFVIVVGKIKYVFDVNSHRGIKLKGIFVYEELRVFWQLS
jgi:hypothetical protein